MSAASVVVVPSGERLRGKGRHGAWCCLQLKLCDPCLSALRACVRTKMALYKYSSFPLLMHKHTRSYTKFSLKCSNFACKLRSSNALFCRLGTAKHPPQMPILSTTSTVTPAPALHSILQAATSPTRLGAL